MDLRDEIADEISGIQVGAGYYSTTIGIDAAQGAADAIMPLVRRAQAEAVASVVTERAREHWSWAQARRERFNDKGCICELCGVMARIEAVTRDLLADAEWHGETTNHEIWR